MFFAGWLMTPADALPFEARTDCHLLALRWAMPTFGAERSFWMGTVKTDPPACPVGAARAEEAERARSDAAIENFMSASKEPRGYARETKHELKRWRGAGLYSREPTALSLRL